MHAEKHEFVAGVVGWVDLRDPEVGLVLDELAQNPRFKGVRHVWHDEPNDDWILQPEVIGGLKEVAARGLTYDFLTFPRHLRHIPEVLERAPGLRTVVDHISKPPIARGELEPWRSDLRKVAEIPGVYCKLSGMVTEADLHNWTIEDLRPYVDAVIEMFGYGRLMYGSDWPVCTMAASYDRVFEAAQALLSGVSEDDRQGRLWRKRETVLPPMKYNTLGRTGLKVPALSFGASSLGGAVHEVAVSEAIETVHAAMDLGLNFVDVSPYYSGTVAELILGRRSGASGGTVTASRPRWAGMPSATSIFPPNVSGAAWTSLSRLGLDYVDLIQCHDIEFGSLDQIVEETIPAFQKLREQGKVRHIGVTGLPLKVFEEVVRHSSVDTSCHIATTRLTIRLWPASSPSFRKGKSDHQCLAFQHGTAHEPRR